MSIRFRLHFFLGRTCGSEMSRLRDRIFCINRDQRSAGFQSVGEKLLENYFLIAIAVRMLFPNERIGRDGIQLLKIFRSKRPERKKFSF